MIWGRERWRSEWRQLQDVDWQGLDVKEAGEWPALLKALCGGLAFVIAVGGLSWWLVSDKRAESNQHQTRLSWCHKISLN